MILTDYLNAGFSGIWILTAEPEECQKEILKQCKEEDIILSWDADRGISFPRDLDKASSPESKVPTYPLTLFRKGQTDERRTLVLLHNFHLFLENAFVLQGLINAVVEGKAADVHYLVLSPVLGLRTEIEKLFQVVEHKRPDDRQLGDIARQLLDNRADTVIGEAVLSAARGLTRREAEDAFSLSIATKGELDPEVIWDIKTQAVRKKGHLQVYRGKEDFKSVGGLQGLKDFTRKLLTNAAGIKARGVLLLGPPGVGKSLFAKTLGTEVGRPTLLLDMARMHHKHVGQSEENIREALAMADAMAPCIVFCDEVEKAVAGAGSEGDSGVSSRLFGTLLTYLNDHQTDTFWVMTTNDISRLPPEFSRAERFDGVFFIDLPTEEERNVIWCLYGDQYALDVDNNLQVNDEGWTGAEISACCRLSKAMGLSLKETQEYIVPVSITAQDKIRQLKEWAQQRCLSAATGQIYRGVTRKESKISPVSRRKIEKKEEL